MKCNVGLMTLEETVPKAKIESQKPISHSPSLTTSLCPSCKTVIPAKIYYSDGKVLMEKNCSKHGKTVSLISSDSKLYEESFSYNIPGKIYI